MTEDMRKVLDSIIALCLDQDSCGSCPISNICGKLPCELVEAKEEG